MYTQGYNDAMSQLGLVTEKTAAPLNKQQIQEIVEQTTKALALPNKPQAGSMFRAGLGKVDDAMSGLTHRVKDQAVTHPWRTMGITAGGAGALGAGAGMPTGIAIGRGSERRRQEG
jgi:hypothetical protein